MKGLNSWNVFLRESPRFPPREHVQYDTFPSRQEKSRFLQQPHAPVEGGRICPCVNKILTFFSPASSYDFHQAVMGKFHDRAGFRHFSRLRHSRQPNTVAKAVQTVIQFQHRERNSSRLKHSGGALWKIFLHRERHFHAAFYRLLLRGVWRRQRDWSRTTLCSFCQK